MLYVCVLHAYGRWIIGWQISLNNSSKYHIAIVNNKISWGISWTSRRILEATSYDKNNIDSCGAPVASKQLTHTANNEVFCFCSQSLALLSRSTLHRSLWWLKKEHCQKRDSVQFSTHVAATPLHRVYQITCTSMFLSEFFFCFSQWRINAVQGSEN